VSEGRIKMCTLLRPRGGWVYSSSPYCVYGLEG